jgi:hypothetical protein
MIRRLSDLALNNCFRVLRLAILPVRMGRCLVPKTVHPLEIVMNGVPHLTHLCSVSLFGLSSRMLIF